MPGVKDEDIDRIEEIISKAEPISTLIDQGLSPEEIMDNLFGEFDMEVLEKEYIEFRCNCSRDRIEGVLISLGKEEINKIIEEDEKAEVVCHFCNKKYNFSKEDLIKLID